LILTPTRELAIQIEESFKAYGKFTRLHSTVIFGGVGQKPQTDALQRGVDILIATPGRLIDPHRTRVCRFKEYRTIRIG
jgi:ATP-dependent RNA helicase RhlE